MLRNTERIYKEHKAYNYNPIVNAYYKDFQQNFKISKSIEKINMCIDNSTDYKCENEDIKSAIYNSDLVIIHTEWNDFKSINFKSLIKKKSFIIYDMRNIYSPSKMKKAKIKYFGIGR